MTRQFVRLAMRKDDLISSFELDWVNRELVLDQLSWSQNALKVVAELTGPEASK